MLHLSTPVSISDHVRGYAHCGAASTSGAPVLAVAFANGMETPVRLEVGLPLVTANTPPAGSAAPRSSSGGGWNVTVYALTTPDLASNTVMLNGGSPLLVDAGGNLPLLRGEPTAGAGVVPTVVLPPRSVVFAEITAAPSSSTGLRACG